MPSPAERRLGLVFLAAAGVFVVAGVVASGGQQVGFDTSVFSVPVLRLLLWGLALVWLVLGVAQRFGHRGLLALAGLGIAMAVALYLLPVPDQVLDSDYSLHCPTMFSAEQSTNEGCVDVHKRRSLMLTFVGAPTAVVLVAGVALAALRGREKSDDA